MNNQITTTRILLPPRCYTCGIPIYQGYNAALQIGNFGEIYDQSLISDRQTFFVEEINSVELRNSLENLRITRFCCLRMILGCRQYVPQR